MAIFIQGLLSGSEEVRKVSVGDRLKIATNGMSWTTTSIEVLSSGTVGVYGIGLGQAEPSLKAYVSSSISHENGDRIDWSGCIGAAAPAPVTPPVIPPEARIEQLAKALFKTDEKVLTFAKTVSEFGGCAKIAPGVFTAKFDYASLASTVDKMWERNEKEWRTAALSRARAMLESGF